MNSGDVINHIFDFWLISPELFCEYQFNDTHTGPESIVKLLIENGADLDTANVYNNTALTFAIENGIYKYVKNIEKKLR